MYFLLSVFPSVFIILFSLTLFNCPIFKFFVSFWKQYPKCIKLFDLHQLHTYLPTRGEKSHKFAITNLRGNFICIFRKLALHDTSIDTHWTNMPDLKVWFFLKPVELILFCYVQPKTLTRATIGIRKVKCAKRKVQHSTDSIKHSSMFRAGPVPNLLGCGLASNLKAKIIKIHKINQVSVPPTWLSLWLKSCHAHRK